MKRIILCILLVFSLFGFSQESPFFNIVRKGTIEEASTYIKSNPTCVNEVNKFGFSPLILACYNGNDAMVTFLIENKANINYVSSEGTVLMAATVKGNVSMVELLLKNGANPNLTNSTGVTALMYAVQFKNSKIVNLLLQFKADKLQIDNNGKSAFEYAVFSNNEEIINLLK